MWGSLWNHRLLSYLWYLCQWHVSPGGPLNTCLYRAVSAAQGSRDHVNLCTSLSLPESDQRWPLKVVIHLTQKTLQDHANQEVQIFVFTLRTLMKLPTPSSVCIFEKPPSIVRMSLYGSDVCLSTATTVEVVGVPGQTVGLDTGSVAQKRVLNFCCICFQMQRVMLNLRCRCRFSGHWAHPGKQSSQDAAQNSQSSWAD